MEFLTGTSSHSKDKASTELIKCNQYEKITLSFLPIVFPSGLITERLSLLQLYFALVHNLFDFAIYFALIRVVRLTVQNLTYGNVENEEMR